MNFTIISTEIISNIFLSYHINRCSSSSLLGNVIVSDAGRDNRKSAAAGAKNGQFSGGFVTRESLHGGQWPHSPSPRASSPIYLLPCVPRETWSFPHVERLQLQMCSTVLHEIVTYAWTLSDKATSFPWSQKPTW